MYNVKELEASAGHTSFEAFRYTPELFDAKLSDFGIEQAKKAAQLTKNLQVTHVYVSPLRRAIKTAEQVFSLHDPLPKFIVLPLLRELMTISCDIPVELETVKQEFPKFDFSLFDSFRNQDLWSVETFQDDSTKSTLLSEYNETKKKEPGLLFKEFLLKKLTLKGEALESRMSIKTRMELSKEFLKERIKEGQKAALVSHYTFLKCFTGTRYSENGKPKDGYIFENCEVKEYQL